jgi:hypothetical protein
MVTENTLQHIFDFNIINARYFQLHGNSKLVKEIKDENDKIVKIQHSSGNTIKLKEQVKIDGLIYKISKINKIISEESKISSYNCISYELSKTAQFILPLLGLKVNQLFRDDLLCNAYIGYKDEYGKHLYLLYRCNDEEKFNILEENLLELNLDLKTIHINDDFCLFRLNFPLKFINDIKIIMYGKYSKISQEAKFCIIQFYKATKNSPIYQILYKTEERKKIVEEKIGKELPNEAELFSVFDEREIYN